MSYNIICVVVILCTIFKIGYDLFWPESDLNYSTRCGLMWSFSLQLTEVFNVLRIYVDL